MQLHQGLGDGQAQAEAGPVTAIKRFEDALPVLRGDTGSRVDHAHDDLSLLDTAAHLDTAAARRIALGVGEEVNQHLLEAQAIDQESGVGRGQPYLQGLMLGRDEGLDDARSAGDDVAQGRLI